MTPQGGAHGWHQRRRPRPGLFNAFVEYVLRQSGGSFEVTAAARALGITRPTVESHLRALELTHAASVIRPFHGGGQNELARQPKVYGFDTGMVSFARGWDPLRADDLGVFPNLDRGPRRAEETGKRSTATGITRPSVPPARAGDG